MYWLIRRSAATGFASLFYLVPAVTALMAYLLFGEKLDALSVAGMVVCAVGVVLVNRGAPPSRPRRPDYFWSRAPTASASPARTAGRRRA